MKTKMKTTLIIFNFILLLVLTSFSAFKAESYRKGDYFYLKLAPVDPRSLIQGDYMILNYEIVDELWARLNNTRNNMKVGYIVAKIDENKVAHFIDVVDKPFNDKNLIFIKFKSNSYNIKINADSFLFQEGEAKTYENAKYSKVVIVNNVLRLVDLVNEI